MKGHRDPGGYWLHEYLPPLCGASVCILAHVMGMFQKLLFGNPLPTSVHFSRGVSGATFIFEK